ncbi:GGDEF domain-containing phosphodiesterase [Lachnoclostridium phytofermentans]|uniref:Diguanylate cyclase/phosphodiesterase n=1 Tax=Lachnoclostridium phytofermentans (strain ATCC 700394 / DSM 18823 / ISDg) TaxID=357809 RepID=A9KRZ6_LACP7|nr:GGDEF domain-containing phosphodiesterase [Lachnoclostridium phytofermentans]ABX40627.1 diguanylate cyclase/phosphodiesterase [Lachnoclostridium phytofermentans ISDg]
MILGGLSSRRGYYDEHNTRNKRKIRFFVIMGIGILSIVAFLLSLKGMLHSEAEKKLLEYTGLSADYIKKSEAGKQFMEEKWGSGIFTIIPGAKNPTYFQGNAHSYVVTIKGEAIGAFSESGKDALSIYGNNVIDSIETWEDTKVYQEIIDKKGLVILTKLANGEKYYIAFTSPSWLENGYIISIVSYQEIIQEIQSVLKMAIVIVLFSLLAIILAFFYSILHRNRIKKRRMDMGAVDKITGLPNPLLHKKKVKEKLTKGNESYAYVTFCIDNFELIYELSGKQYCEKLLKQIASKIQIMLVDGELFTRYQNDEFGMLLEYHGELNLRKRLVEMFKYAGDLPQEDNNFCSITFQCGVCEMKKNMDVKDLIQYARQVRNNEVNGYTPNIEFYNKKEEKGEQPKIEEITNALSHNEFLVYLQPILQLDTKRIAGAEALVRWNHKMDGILPPNVFLPMLEEDGSIVKLDMYVLEEVCEYLRDWMDKGKRAVPISVNLSGKHLERPEFITELVEIVDYYQIPHELLEFEFSEVNLYGAMDMMKNAIQKLRELGFLIAIDQFGAGFSSLQLLKELPIHVLKIDKKLIMNLEDSEFSNQEKTIVMHILSFAKARNLTVIAEGVETKEQQDLLIDQQCDMMQGFYYQKPMPSEEFERLLDASGA